MERRTNRKIDDAGAWVWDVVMRSSGSGYNNVDVIFVFLSKAHTDLRNWSRGRKAAVSSGWYTELRTIYHAQDLYPLI